MKQVSQAPAPARAQSPVQDLKSRWAKAREKRKQAREAAARGTAQGQGLRRQKVSQRLGRYISPLVAALTAAAGGSLAISASAQTVITPNGRTATQVSTNGQTSNITTTTVVGNNGFNAFSRFEVGSASTVNLRLPDGTTHLINLVYDAPIRIDGVLNGIQGSSIGGHLVFADPFGMVVGASGVLNVGSLTVTSPTSAFMDGLLNAAGVVDANAVGALLSGAAPRAAGSLIRIDGRINALDRVRLEAEQVQINGAIQASADSAYQEAFIRAVNTNGLQQATGMVDKGGTIEIVGTTLSVNGLLDASGKLGGGTVAVGRVGDSKADSLSVGATGTIKADATQQGNGGSITLWGTSQNSFAGTASARGGVLGGDGGFVEVSGQSGLLYAGTVFTDAPHGADGRLLIDPSVLCIVNSVADACASGSQALVTSLLSGTGNVSLEATDTLYVGSSSGGAATLDLTQAGRSIDLFGWNKVQVNAGSQITTNGGSVTLRTSPTFSESVVMKAGSSIVTNGGDVTFKATDISLTGALIDASKAVGNGGKVLLTTTESPDLSGNTVTIASGSVIRADGSVKGGTVSVASRDIVVTDSTLSAAGSEGAVKVEAKASNLINLFGFKKASSSVTVTNGVISADDVTISATTTIENKPFLEADGSASGAGAASYANLTGTVGLLSDLISNEGLSVLQFMTGASLVLSSVETSAKVAINGDSRINGGNSVTITATTSGEAGNAKSYFDKVSGFLTPVQQTKFGLGAMYLSAKGTADVNIGGTTKLSGGNLTVAARNNINIEGEVETANTDGPGASAAKEQSLLALAVGVALSDAKANTLIDSGVTIQSAGNVSLAAVNYSNVSNSVTAASGADGKVGAAFAYTQQNTSANVTLKANIQDASSATILAIDHTAATTTQATSKAGATPLDRFKSNVEAYASEDGLAALSQYAKEKKTLKSGTVPLRIAGAIALTDENHSAVVNVADNVLIHAKAKAGEAGSGTVLIGARVEDTEITLDAAASAVTSSSGGQSSGSSAKNAAAFGLAIGNYTHNAQALVGNNVTIVGERIGVLSNVEIPMKDMADGSALSADAWSSFSNVKDTLGMFSDTLKLDFVNAKGHAKGSGDEVGISGSITLMSAFNTSRAEVGAKTQLLTNSDAAANTDGGFSWGREYELVAEDKTNNVDQVTAGFSANGAVAIQASTKTALIVQTGEALSTNEGKGVGLSNGYVGVTNTTDAILREGVKIAKVTETATGSTEGERTYVYGAESKAVDATVRASNESLIVNFTIGAGKSTGGGAAGMAVETFVTNHAVASVDNEAVIKSNALRVEAADTPTVYSIAGTVNMSSQTTIGVALAVNEVSTNTVAEIADNDLVKTADGLARTSAYALDGQILVTDLSVAAHTGGAVYGIAVAGSITSTDPTPGAIGTALNKLNQTFNKGLCAANNLMGQGDMSCAVSQTKQKADSTGWSVSGAGSVSVTTTDFFTVARLEGTQNATNEVTNLHVNSTGDANIVSVAGGAAITLGGKGSKNTGNATVAGAVAVNVIGNKVESSVTDVTIDKLNSVDISAFKGGENLSIGLGLAVSTDTSDKKSVGFAGAASITLDREEEVNGVAQSKNAARAIVTNAKLVGADTGNADIVAYNSTRIGTGGGSMTAQGKNSLGASVTYAEIGNATEVFITNSAFTKFQQETVLAHSASQIVAAAASASVSVGQTDSTQLTGAIVITNISNTTQATVKNTQLDGTDGVTVTAREGTRQTAYENKLKQGSVVAELDEEGKPNGYSYTGSDLFTADSMVGGNSGSSILGIAGNLQVSTGTNSTNVGASVSINLISNTVKASVDGDPSGGGKASSTSNLVVTADSSDYIRAVAAGVSIADDLSIGGSIAINRVTNTTSASVNGLSARGAQVLAQDNSNIDSLAGQISISKGSQGTAVGGALAYNEIGNDTSANVSNAAITGGLNGTRSQVTADVDSNARIRSLAAAGAVAPSGSGSAFSGSIGFNLIGNDQSATLSHVTLGSMTGGSDLVRVTADDHSLIQTLSGAASFGMQSSFGGAISTNTITNTNTASASDVNGSGIENTEVKTTADGTIEAIAVGVAASSDKLAIAGSVTVNTITNVNSASLTGSQISGGSLNVSDSDTSKIDAISGAAAVSPSGTAIGVAFSTNTITNSNSAGVTGSTLTLTGGSTIQSVQDATIRALSASGGLSEKVTVTGALSVNTIKNTTAATVGTSTLTSVGATVLAKDKSKIQNLSGAVAVSLNNVAVGVGASVNTIANGTSVSVDRSVLDAGTSAASVQALNEDTIEAIAVSAAVSGGTTSVSVAGSANTVTNTTRLESLGSTISGTGVALKASDTARISAINGAAGISLGNVAVGGAIGANTITNTTSVLVDDKFADAKTYASTLAGGTGAVTVQAISNEDMKTLAAAATGSAGNVAVSGSVVNALITNTTTATVRDSVVTGGSASISASDTGTISSLGGSVAISFGTAAVGAAVVVNTIANTTKAAADHTSITVTNAADVTSANSQKIESIGVAGAVAADAAVSISSTTNTITNTTDARIANGSSVSSSGGSVRATDSSAVQTIAGAAAIGFSAAAVGGAISVNTVTNNTTAYVNDSTLSPGASAFNTTANSTGSIKSLAAAGSGSGGASIAGSVAVNTIANKTEAQLEGTSVTSATTGDIGVSATDSSSIAGLAGAVAVGGAASVGAAIAANTIANTINARVLGNTAQTALIAGSGNLTVSAFSNSAIKGAAAGLAADANVGVAGTLVSDVISTSVEAAIDKNADVDIGGTAAVLAKNKDQITTVGGSAGIGLAAAGVGASGAVNIITGTTRAQIGDNDTGGKRTRVDALGNTAATVSGGGLDAASEPLDRLASFSSAAEFVAPAMNVADKSTRGVAVNALAVRTINSGAFSIGAGSVGVAGTIATNAITGDTQARITSADINQRQVADTSRLANAAQDVDVQSASHTRAFSFTGSVGAGLYAGVGASIDGSGIGVNTTAAVTDSNTRAARDINVKSLATEGAAQLDVGVSGALVGVQGSAAIAIFRGTTSSQLAGGTASAGSDVNVTALHKGFFSINAGAAAGGAVGVAGAINVAVNNHTVLAQIGYDAGATTTVTAGDDIDVDAQSKTEIMQWSASGAAGGGAVALAATAAVLEDKATAKVSRATLTAADRTDVNALVDSTIQQRGGGIALSAGGSVAATVGMAFARGTAAASVENSTVTSNMLDVTAVNRQDLDGISIGVSASGAAGIAGSMQLNMVGFGAAGDSSGTLTGSGGGFSVASGFANQDRLSGSNDLSKNKLISDNERSDVNSAALTAGERSSVNSATRYDFSGAMSSTNANSSTAKVVNSTIRVADGATNGLNVDARSETAVRTIAGSAGAGLGGVGGALGITRVYNLVQANIDAATDIGARTGSVAPNVTINGLATDKAGQWGTFGSAAPSEDRQTVSSRAVAAGLGAVGVSMAISDVKVDNVVTSTVSATRFVAGDVKVGAVDNSDASSQSYGVAAGLGAAGVATSTLERTGAITAGATVGSSGTPASVYTMYVGAGEAGTLVSNVFAGSAGVGVAVQGNGANVIDNRNVGATLGAGTNLSVLGEVVVQAARSPQLSTQVWGAALSGLAGLGVSVAEAKLGGNTTALVGAGSTFSGTGDVSVLAVNTTPLSGAENVTAFAAAGSGGLFLGAAGSGATTSDTSNASATIDSNTNLLNTGDVTISASNGFASTAYASGVAGGIVGVGVVVAKSTATGTTLARLGDNITTSIARLGDPYFGLPGGSIIVTTDGNRKTHAYALAGAGGLVAGAGASATSQQSGDSVVQIGAPAAGPAPASSKALYADAIIARATPTYTVGSATEAFQVSLLGASASVSRAEVGSSSNTVRARTEIGPGTIMAAQYIELDAVQTTRGEIVPLAVPTPTNGALSFSSGTHFQSNAGGSGGGVLSFSGADSEVTAFTGATTSVGSGSILSVYGNPTDLERTSNLRIGARSAGVVGNSVTLDTGGLIASPNAHADTTLNQTTRVVLGDNTQLYSDGLIEIGTVNNTVANARSYVKVYGLASIGSSQADTTVTDNQSIAIGAGSSLFSWGDTRIMTGKHSDLTYSNDIAALASADAFTGFVGTSDQHAYATINSSGQVLLGGLSAQSMGGTRATLTSNRSIRIGSDDGRLAAGTSGSSTSLLEQLFSASSSDNRSISTPTSSLLINANMTAGARNSQIITIDANGNITSKPSDVDVIYVAANASNAFNPGASLSAKIAELKAQKQTAQNELDAMNQAKADAIQQKTVLQGQLTGLTGDALLDKQADIQAKQLEIDAYTGKIATLTGSVSDYANQIVEMEAVQSAAGYTNSAVNSFSIGMTGRTPDIVNGVASGARYALWASGGNIALQSRNVSGSGTLTANGGASIQITSASPAHLLIGDMTIPDLGPGGGTGGAITVSGGGSLTGSNLVIREVNRDVAPVIRVLSTYKQVGSEDPGSIFISGFANNLAGLFELKKTSGNITMTGGYNAQTVNIEAPEGVVFFGNPGADQSLAGNPESMWNDYLPTDPYLLAALAAQLDYARNYGAAAAGAANGETFFHVGTTNTQGTSGTAIAWFGINDPHSDTGGGANTVFVNRGNGSFLGGVNQGNYGTYGYYKGLRLPNLPLNYGTARTLSLSQSNTNASGAFVAGQLAVIRARVLNVNGAVRAGRAASYSISINNTPITTYTQQVIGYIFGTPIYQQVAKTINPVQCLQDAACRPTIADRGVDGLWRIKGGYDTKTQQYTGLRAQFFPTLAAGDAPISVAYDAAKNEFVTDGLQGGGGGTVMLSGQIISTRQSNMGGSVSVNAGVSNITINNSTNVMLNTGEISPGSASAGVIQFTDALKKDAYNRDLKTWFVYQAGQAVQRYESYTAADWRDAGAAVGGSTTQYDPLSGMRYSWTRYYTASRTYTENNSGDQPYTHWILGAWNTTSGWTSDTLVSKNIYRDTGDTSDYRQTFSLYSLTAPGVGGYRYSYKHSDGQTSTRWWAIPTRFTLQSTSSVRADYPIAISFGGNAAGTVNVTSAGGLRVSGNINNLNGTTSLRTTAGSLSTAADVTVQTRNLSLTSAGSIGGASSGNGAGDGYGYSSAFNVVMGSGGTVQATAVGDINLRLGGSSTTLNGTGLSSTNGQVNVSLAQSLFGQAGSNAQITGTAIKLLSDAGALGASGLALRLNARNINPIGLGATGVTAMAQGSIYLDQLGGDLRIGSIASRTGDIWVRTPGSIVAMPSSRDDSRSDEELADLWNRMSLTGSAALTTATNNSVNPYVAGVNQSYSEYWGLRSLASSYTPASGNNPASIVLNTDGLNGWRGRAAVALGLAQPSDEQVQTYANQRLGQLEAGFASAVGNNWQSQSEFQAYNSSWTFTASAEQTASLTSGAQWNQNALINNINANALKPAGGTAPLGATAVKGSYITLIAGRDIGNLLDPMVITIADGATDVTLTTAQKAALYRASAPGDVQLGYYGNGKLASLTVAQVRPLVVENTTGMTIQAYSNGAPVNDVYLQTSGPLTVSSLNLTGNGRILAGQGITSTTAPGQLTFTVGKDLLLDGGSGSLGSAATPISLVTGGILQAARATGDVYLSNLSAPSVTDLNYGAISAGGLALIRVGGSLVTPTQGVSIVAGSLDIVAGGSVGSGASPISFQLVGSGGTVSAQAGSTLALRQTGAASDVKLLKAGNGDVDYRSTDAGGITVDGLVDASGGVILLTAGDLAFTGSGTLNAHAGVAQVGGNSLVMSAGSRMRVGGTAAYLAAYNGAMTLSDVQAGSIYATAYNGVLGGASYAGVTDLVATSATGSIFLNSAPVGSAYGTGIGSSGRALRVAGANLYATTAQGSANLAISGDTNAQLINASQGSVSVSSAGAITAQQLSAGNGALSVSAATNLNAIQASASGAQGSVSLQATAGALTVNTVSASQAAGLRAGTQVSAGSISAGGGVNVSGPQRVIIGSLSAGANSTLTAASGTLNLSSGSLSAGQLSATAGTAGGNIGSLSAAGGASLSAGSWNIGTLSSGAGANIGITATSGGIQYASLNAGQDLTLTANSGTISSQSGALASGRNVTYNAAAALVGNLTSTIGGSLSVTTSSGSIATGSLSSQGALSLASGLDLSSGPISAANAPTSLSAGRSLSLSGNSSVASLLASASGGINIATVNANGGSLSVSSSGGAVSIASASAGTTATVRALTLTDIASLTAAGNILVSTSAANSTLGITNASTSGGTLSLTSAGQANVLGQTSSAGQTTISGTALNLANVSTTGAAGDIVLTATAGGIQYSNINAKRNLSLSASGTVAGLGSLNYLVAAGNLTGSAAGFSGYSLGYGGSLALTTAAGASAPTSYALINGVAPPPSGAPAPAPAPTKKK
jgi:hypothetical protein